MTETQKNGNEGMNEDVVYFAKRLSETCKIAIARDGMNEGQSRVASDIIRTPNDGTFKVRFIDRPRTFGVPSSRERVQEVELENNYRRLTLSTNPPGISFHGNTGLREKPMDADQSRLYIDMAAVILDHFSAEADQKGMRIRKRNLRQLTELLGFYSELTGRPLSKPSPDPAQEVMPSVPPSPQGKNVRWSLRNVLGRGKH